jgi:hypothetical protein
LHPAKLGKSTVRVLAVLSEGALNIAVYEVKSQQWDRNMGSVFREFLSTIWLAQGGDIYGIN